jgi:hypothetical protein
MRDELSLIRVTGNPLNRPKEIPIQRVPEEMSVASIFQWPLKGRFRSKISVPAPFYRGKSPVCPCILGK